MCGGQAGDAAFPYATVFNAQRFDYLRCLSCGAVFVDPVPDTITFELMYTKDAYHDRHYFGGECEEYAISAQMLRKFLPEGAAVLDYGCGFGAFLKALRSGGLIPTGAEFDAGAAKFAASCSQERVYSVAEFEALADKPLFDAVHFGDVLEHLPDPLNTLRTLLRLLRPGGLVFAEGRWRKIQVQCTRRRERSEPISIVWGKLR